MGAQRKRLTRLDGVYTTVAVLKDYALNTFDDYKKSATTI